MQVKKQQFATKLGKEYVKVVYCHPAYLTSMQSTSCEMQGCKNYRLESRLLTEIPAASDMQIIPSLWQKAKGDLMKVKEESEKSGLKQH